jgi:valyl-tRNA synthetase
LAFSLLSNLDCFFAVILYTYNVNSLSVIKMSEDKQTDVKPNAEPALVGEEAATGDGEGQTKLSKNQLKKLAKNKGKEKKEKPKWGEPKKEKKAKAAPPPKQEFVNTTPKGEKKDLSKIPMADAYNPQAVEAAWQDWWEARGFYSCDPAKAINRPVDEKFVMVIPPPNVTGSLHLGHALTAAVEDTLTRWHRMKGHATLYVPGTSFFKSCDILYSFTVLYRHAHGSTGQPHAITKNLFFFVRL